MRTLYVTDLDGTLLNTQDRIHPHSLRIINELAAQGKAIIMISSDMNEVVAMSDRVIVMHDGEIRGELEGAEINPEAVLKYAIE